MGFEKQLCIYCNKDYSTRSGDHVPPQSFFPAKKGYNLVQVPCCQKCNTEYSVLDQHARNFIAMLETNENHALIKDELQHTVLRDWSKEGRKRLFISKFIDLEAIAQLIKGKSLRHPSKITDEELKNFPMPIVITDDIHKFVGRMARALAFKDLDLRLDNWKHRTRFIEQLSASELESVTYMKNTMEMKTLGEDTFRWITFWNKPNGTVLCWMQFYLGTEIIAVLGSEKLVG